MVSRSDFPAVIRNIPRNAGGLAEGKKLFGGYSRYAIAPVHTRFDAVQWFVWDAELIDAETGMSSVIRQSDDFETAIKGLI